MVVVEEVFITETIHSIDLNNFNKQSRYWRLQLVDEGGKDENGGIQFSKFMDFISLGLIPTMAGFLIFGNGRLHRLGTSNTWSCTSLTTMDSNPSNILQKIL